MESRTNTTNHYTENSRSSHTNPTRKRRWTEVLLQGQGIYDKPYITMNSANKSINRFISVTKGYFWCARNNLIRFVIWNYCTWSWREKTMESRTNTTNHYTENSRSSHTNPTRKRRWTRILRKKRQLLFYPSQSLRHHSISVSLNSMTMCVINVVGETNTTGTPVPPDDHEPFDYFHSYWNKNTAFYINNVLHGRFWNTMPAIPKYSWLCFFLHPMYPFLKYPLGTLLLG
jgi:hypothetical protein